MTQSIHVELGHLTPTDSSLGVNIDGWPPLIRRYRGTTCRRAKGPSHLGEVQSREVPERIHVLIDLINRTCVCDVQTRELETSHVRLAGRGMVYRCSVLRSNI